MSVAKRNNKSINKMAFDILNRFVGGRASNDTSISLEQIKFNIVNVRAMMLRQDMGKDRVLNRHVEQNLGCVELKLVDEAECCGYNTGCYILRSKDKLPDPVRVRGKDAITFIGSVNGKTIYPSSTPFKSRWRGKGKFVKDEVFSYILENYVYLLNDLKKEVINVKMIAEDPRDAARFSHCSGDPCYTDDDPFPVPADMIPRIEEYVGKTLMQPMVSTPEDQEADLQDSNKDGSIQDS